jgi:hypothetical protein
MHLTRRLRPCNLIELLEALQVLKYSYRSDRLSFVDDLLAKESDYNNSGQLTETAIDELMRAGKAEELKQLIKEMSESNSN